MLHCVYILQRSMVPIFINLIELFQNMKSYTHFARN